MEVKKRTRRWVCAHRGRAEIILVVCLCFRP